MNRTKRLHGLQSAFTLAAACAALAGCNDVPTGPELDLRPSYLIGSSPLALADPRPSPWGDGKGLEVVVNVPSETIGGDIERYAFRTSAQLTLGDGNVARVDAKVDRAATAQWKGDEVVLQLPFDDALQAALGKERGAVQTEVAVELLKDGRTISRVTATAYLKY